MIFEFSSLTVTIAIFWFIIYWILGGVFFAIVVASRFIRLRKARFSCLFSIASATLAYGAASTTTVLSESSVAVCVNKDGSDGFLSLLRCAPNAFFGSGAIWFILLVVIGTVAVLLSRAEKYPVAQRETH